MAARTGSRARWRSLTSCTLSRPAKMSWWMGTGSSQLISKSCTPCRGGIPPLTPDEAKAHLRQTPEWALLDDAHRIERTFRFKNFAEAFAFVQRAADLAEADCLPRPDAELCLRPPAR